MASASYRRVVGAKKPVIATAQLGALPGSPRCEAEAPIGGLAEGAWREPVDPERATEFMRFPRAARKG